MYLHCSPGAPWFSHEARNNFYANNAIPQINTQNNGQEWTANSKSIYQTQYILRFLKDPRRIELSRLNKANTSCALFDRNRCRT